MVETSDREMRAFDRYCPVCVVPDGTYTYYRYCSIDLTAVLQYGIQSRSNTVNVQHSTSNIMNVLPSSSNTLQTFRPLKRWTSDWFCAVYVHKNSP